MERIRTSRILVDSAPEKSKKTFGGTYLFARHGHNLTGASPERAPIAGSA